jgi:hypothetical protein
MTALHCAGCGCEGRMPTIVMDKAQEPPEPPLSAVFGWHEDGRPALLCPSCNRGLRRNRGRARYAKRRPSDGHTTP